MLSHSVTIFLTDWLDLKSPIKHTYARKGLISKNLFSESVEASTGIEPVYTDLQSAASPLRQLATDYSLLLAYDQSRSKCINCLSLEEKID